MGRPRFNIRLSSFGSSFISTVYMKQISFFLRASREMRFIASPFTAFSGTPRVFAVTFDSKDSFSFSGSFISFINSAIIYAYSFMVTVTSGRDTVHLRSVCISLEARATIGVILYVPAASPVRSTYTDTFLR